VDCGFIESFEVKAARKGASILMEARETITEGERKGTIPLTFDALLRAKGTVFDIERDINQLMYYTAIISAYMLLLRVSEYVMHKEGKHHLRRRDVVFWKDGQQVEPVKCNIGEFHAIDKVTINIHSSKTDKKGKGHRFVMDKRVEGDKCLCTLLANWVRVRGMSKEDDPLFGYYKNGVFNSVNAKQLGEELKKIARREGLDPNRVIPHSLRYGAASALAAAGAPSHIIQVMGRWKSLGFLTYIVLSTKAYNNASKMLTDSECLTSEDVKLRME
jgi:integrase